MAAICALRRGLAAEMGDERKEGQDMKRVGIWTVYVIGALSIVYLALYAYAMLTRPQLVPGEPIQIFRKPDAPKYS